MGIYIIVILLLIALGFSLYGNIKLVKKNEILEDFIFNVQQNIMTAIENMRLIDSKGAFEIEDEVGQTFQMLLDTVNKLGIFVGDINESEKTKKEVK